MSNLTGWGIYLIVLQWVVSQVLLLVSRLGLKTLGYYTNKNTLEIGSFSLKARTRIGLVLIVKAILNILASLHQGTGFFGRVKSVLFQTWLLKSLTRILKYFLSALNQFYAKNASFACKKKKLHKPML